MTIKPLSFYTRAALTLLMLAISYQTISATPYVETTPVAKKTFSDLMKFTAKKHYKKDIVINDQLSEKILEELLKYITADKSLFTQKQINEFSKDQHAFDDAIKSGDPTLGMNIYNSYLEIQEQRSLYEKTLALQVDEKLIQKAVAYGKTKNTFLSHKEYDDQSWSKSDVERKQRWREHVYLRIAGYKELEYTAEEMTTALIDFSNNKIKQLYERNPLNGVSAFSNAIFALYDPHTSYMAPEVKKSFETSMGLSFYGIGTMLTRKKRYIQITRVIEGGPAFKNGTILKGSRIVEIKKDPDSEPIKVIGWTVSDVVKAIRGPKGIPLWVSYIEPDQPDDAPLKTVKLIRDKIDLEDEFASLEYIDSELSGVSKKVAVIKVPSFYTDFAVLTRQDPDARSVSKDVKRLLEEINEANVTNLVIDLRGNGGGSLWSVVQMVGFFIPHGVTVYTKDYDGSILSFDDPDGGEMIYKGALAVLIDGGSASASEIFSGAIQDYQRGWVFGAQTFGKGSVQTLEDFGDAGALKYTNQQFFLPLGSSTQWKGVTPDVVLPDVRNNNWSKERDLPNSLSWSSIFPPRLSGKGWAGRVAPHLASIEKVRLRTNHDFTFLNQVTELYDDENQLTYEEREKKIYDLEMTRRTKKGEATVSAKEFKKNSDKLEWWLDKKLPAKKDPVIQEAAYLVQKGNSLY